MGKVFDKFLNLLGFEIVEEDEPDVFLNGNEAKKNPEQTWYDKKVTKWQDKKEERKPELFPVPNAYSAKMVICRPDSFDSVRQAADHLREKHSVVVDLTDLSIEQAQRVLDYLSGVAFAIDGNASRVGSGIFLFTPANVSIEGAVDLVFPGLKEGQDRETSSQEIKTFLKSVGA
ncbi:MAG: cell division protein SepF [Desulfotomaculum sp.]|nr:cell division protein SepF [Desulfotomaculum sp.]